MREPKSFELISALGMETDVICLEYRARNGFGGMNVERSVVVGTALTPSSAKTFTKTWNSRCAGKTGADLTTTVNRML